MKKIEYKIKPKNFNKLISYLKKDEKPLLTVNKIKNGKFNK
tara:strand:+ start:4599 stop:4721 length:123 start_codon:yes stop_codon:yes gene_type:complete